MPSFKKREPGTRAQASSMSALALSKADGTSKWNREDGETFEAPISNTTSSENGLRPSPYPSPVPLFSTGLASLDDYITGHGLPSSSLLVLVPSIGLTSLEISSGGNEDDATSTKDAARIATERRQRAAALANGVPSTSRVTLEALKAAEETLLDLSSYGAAQGLLAGHEVIVAGQHARQFATKRMPNRVTGRGDASSATTLAGRAERIQADVPPHDVDAKATMSGGVETEAMKIAFRYAHRPQFKTTVDEPTLIDIETDAIPEEHRFRAPFDLSRKWSAQQLAAAESAELGRLVLAESTRYDEAWRVIDDEVLRLKQLSTRLKVPVPPIRIHLLGLGSVAWARPNESFQHRLVHLSRFLIRIRHLLRRLALDEGVPIHAICSVTISPELLSPPWQMIVTKHLLRLADAQVLLSDFALDKHLARAYAGYGGSVSLMKGPSIGSVSAPGEKRSILRGGGGEAGAENDVGWRRRPRGRGIVLETLHEDVDADLKKDETKSKTIAKNGSSTTQHRGDDIEEAALGLVRKPKQTAAPHKHEGHTHPHGPPIRNDSVSPPPAKAAPRFEGLKSLRERGLRATKPVTIDVEPDDGPGDV